MHPSPLVLAPYWTARAPFSTPPPRAGGRLRQIQMVGGRFLASSFRLGCFKSN